MILSSDGAKVSPWRACHEQAANPCCLMFAMRCKRKEVSYRSKGAFHQPITDVGLFFSTNMSPVLMSDVVGFEAAKIPWASSEDPQKLTLSWNSQKSQHAADVISPDCLRWTPSTFLGTPPPSAHLKQRGARLTQLQGLKTSRDFGSGAALDHLAMDLEWFQVPEWVDRNLSPRVCFGALHIDLEGLLH